MKPNFVRYIFLPNSSNKERFPWQLGLGAWGLAVSFADAGVDHSGIRKWGGGGGGGGGGEQSQGANVGYKCEKP